MRERVVTSVKRDDDLGFCGHLKLEVQEFELHQLPLQLLKALSARVWLIVLQVPALSARV